MSEHPGRLTQQQLDTFAAARNSLPVCDFFGFKIAFHLDESEGDCVEITLDDVKPGQRGGLGTSAVNGGVLAAIFDFAVGYAATLAPPLRKSATVQLSLNLESAVLGNLVRCTARIVKQARNILFVSAEIADETGKICARGTGMCALGPEVALEEWTRGKDGQVGP